MHETGRNLKVKDIVLVHDSSPIKGKYTFAIVEEVFQSKDDLSDRAELDIELLG